MNIAVTEKQVYGKKVRTSNQNIHSIFKLWEEFLQLDLKGDVYGVYTNYESDYTGEYDLYIGTEKELVAEHKMIIPAGNYYVVEVDNSNPQGVFHAWEKIWQSDIKRAYQTDFEFYSKDGSIKIFLSIEE
ncbi:GyrI-like domain-containing protein [Bacillus cytotoxicus]|uniref:GyrI-like domain-containing protein n=1 Tax=Bacillus cytotoxicus TaxID=580165 RepID=UPI000661228D|nr:GyrI-like domain-containing protein [Bacillus cytotoxicus]AWC34282.1 AraC family transcriptional regulator [Bacillus cytotoxicus]AWC38281.1 AraC family transcriptional regulator [Bacillus cytotoxicus]AWC62497.1 AraC family transcriptional regulator [Bacillus cytotoxicus]KMT48679.1 AraC family transcriptional regulator [Bacillus cytotoxicus]MDH2881171.1 GyrI-like domain-containing protein [Bacillus cytotoxicus]